MKSIIGSLFLVTSLLLGGAAIAGQGGEGECPESGRMHEKKEAAHERLNLTPEQQVKFDAVMQEMRPEREAARSSSADPNERHAAMMAVGQKTEQRLSEFLTDEQMTEFREMRGEHMVKGAEHRAQMEQRRAETIERLQLTPEQQPEFDAIMMEAHEQRRAAHEQARESGERPDREEMKAARAQTEAKLAGVLTPAQMETWKQMQEERRDERGGHGKGHGKGR